MAEVQWHRTQRTAFLPDGSLEFRVTGSGLHEISWWILGYGDQAEVTPAQEPLRNVIAGCRPPPGPLEQCYGSSK